MHQSYVLNEITLTPSSRPFYFMYQCMCYPLFSVGNRSTVRKIFFNGAILVSGSKSLWPGWEHVVVIHYIISLSIPRFLCRPTAFCSTCWSHGTSERSLQGKQRICRCNSPSAHFHVSWLSDFIFYPKPLYKSPHQSFFYSFITILPSESGVTLHYSQTWGNRNL